MLYAIAHKNRVIVGPMNWSQKYFMDVLKIRHKIQANIPGKEPSELPLILDEHTIIYSVIEHKPEIDNMTHYHYGPIWDLSSNKAIANYEVRELSIDSARNNFKHLLSSERYKREISGFKTTIQGIEITLDTSREGRNIFLQKFLLMSDTDTANWKFPECWLTLTKEELGYIVRQGANHIQSAFDWEKEINLQIDLCNTSEELKLLNIVNNSEDVI
jgi:hypothetical protein